MSDSVQTVMQMTPAKKAGMQICTVGGGGGGSGSRAFRGGSTATGGITPAKLAAENTLVTSAAARTSIDLFAIDMGVSQGCVMARGFQVCYWI